MAYASNRPTADGAFSLSISAPSVVSSLLKSASGEALTLKAMNTLSSGPGVVIDTAVALSSNYVLSIKSGGVNQALLDGSGNWASNSYATNGGAIFVGNSLASGTASLTLTSNVANSGSNVGFVFNTANALSGSTQILSVQKNGSPLLTLYPVGDLVIGNDLYTGALQIVGGKLQNVPSGVQGSGTLNGSGTVTISSVYVTASSRIMLTRTSSGSGVLNRGTITPGVSFVVNSSNGSDAGTFDYFIVN